MSSFAVTQNLESLAAKLTDPQDRETYTRLLVYVHSLPPGDEFRKQMEMLGLLSLIGQRIPDALAAHLVEMRQLTTTAGEYYGQVDERLEKLPAEIAAGVNISTIAHQMAEAFRQQLIDRGVEESVAVLEGVSKAIVTMSGELSNSINPAAQELRALSAAITGEVISLTAVCHELRQQNGQAAATQSAVRSMKPALIAVALLVIGICLGITVERLGAINCVATVHARQGSR